MDRDAASDGVEGEYQALGADGPGQILREWSIQLPV
jgi:hypothetical protein